MTEKIAGKTTLACPYPGCQGSAVATAEGPVEELAVCDKCHRLAARCSRSSAQGRCPTLNRPLARFCRRCRQELEPAWAQKAWVNDVGGRALRPKRAAPTSLSLVPPLEHPDDKLQRVYCLEEHLPYEQWDGRALALHEVGGRLWIGMPDGRSLFVAPFQDRDSGSPIHAEHHWPGSGRMRLRTRTSGLWMVVYSERGLKALNLLGLDDRRRDDPGWLDLWRPQSGESLVSEAAFVRGAGQGLDRSVWWVTNGASGLSLWSARLPLLADQRPEPRRWRIDGQGLVPPLETGESRVALVEAPCGDSDRLLLATTHGLWLVNLPLDPAPGEPAQGTAPAPGSSPRLVSLMRHRALVLNSNDAPGIVFLPAEGTSLEEEACGTAFVACRDERTPTSEVLYAVIFSARRRLHEVPYRDYESVPLCLVAVRGRSQVLCRSGGMLIVSDLVGQQSRTLTNDYLTGAQWLHGYGRLIICSGRASGDGPARWFTLLHNLEEENSLVDHVVTATLGSQPVLLGRNLFTIEPLSHLGRLALWLTRRRLVFGSAT